MPLFIVTVRETGGRSREWEERVRADHAAAAVGRAVRKLFGARASLHRDHGLPGYGQIVRSVTRPGELWSASELLPIGTTSSGSVNGVAKPHQPHQPHSLAGAAARPGWSATCVTGRVAVDVAPVRRGGAS